MLASLKNTVKEIFPRKIKCGPAANLKFIAPYNFDYINGSIEVFVQDALKKYLNPGDVFYDIGANIGFFTILGARLVGHSGKVFSFEPVPENVKSIKKNIKVNAFVNTQVIDKAVSEHSGTEDIYITKNLAGATLTSLGIHPHDAQTKAQVELVTIDDLVLSNKIEPPHFVKVDVEGAEMNVLKGMQKTIAEYRPIILYEVDSGDPLDLKKKLAELDSFMKGKGYTVEHLKDSYAHIKWHVAHALAFSEK